MKAAQDISLVLLHHILSNEPGPCARVIYVKPRSPPPRQCPHQLYIFFLTQATGNSFKIKEQKCDMINPIQILLCRTFRLDYNRTSCKEGGFLEGGGGLSVSTRRPFTFCAACSIFNAAQLTAAHAGSLVKNAACSHGSACFATSVAATHTEGGPWGEEVVVAALTVPVTERGATGVAGVESVFHREAARPLQPAGLLRSGRPLAGLGRLPRAGQQAPLAIVYERDGRSRYSTAASLADLGGRAVVQGG